jgi:shikimate kinase
MAEYKVSFTDPNPQSNPFEFQVSPLPDREFLKAFNVILENYPYQGRENLEVKFDGLSFKALAWDRKYIVGEDDEPMSIANKVYNLQEYSPDYWRNILDANGVEDPLTFKQDFTGKEIKIPARIPQEMMHYYIGDAVKKTNERIAMNSAGTVVLLGFSTTGKSSILRDFKEQYEEEIDTIDTDSLISQDYGGHIYGIFLALVNGADRGQAIAYIEKREREILNGIRPSQKPQLIAAGPGLVIREPAWSDFCDRVKPICFHLEKTAEEVYAGLRQRRTNQLNNPDIIGKDAAGSWDDDVTTRYQNGEYVDIPQADAIRNIERHMRGLVARYDQYAGVNKYKSLEILNNTDTKNEFYAKLRRALGLD